MSHHKDVLAFCIEYTFPTFSTPLPKFSNRKMAIDFKVCRVCLPCRIPVAVFFLALFFQEPLKGI
jgi:hypothetical protein